MHAEQWTHPRSRDGWTEERIERLKSDWTEGYSASQIAARLGGITRNAVIGKVARMGLPRRVEGSKSTSRVWIQPPKRWHIHLRESQAVAGKAAWNKPRMKRDLDKVVTRVTHPRPRVTPTFPLEPIPIPVDELYIAPENRKRLLDLEPNDCRWPIGDPRESSFHFCGGQKVHGFSYCEHHLRRGHQTVQEVDARRLRAMKAA